MVTKIKYSWWTDVNKVNNLLKWNNAHKSYSTKLRMDIEFHRKKIIVINWQEENKTKSNPNTKMCTRDFRKHIYIIIFMFIPSYMYTTYRKKHAKSNCTKGTRKHVIFSRLWGKKRYLFIKKNYKDINRKRNREMHLVFCVAYWLVVDAGSIIYVEQGLWTFQTK